MQPLKIYIASKYSADTMEEKLENTNKSIELGIEIALKGHIPFMPLLTHFFDLKAIEKGINFDWQWYMDYTDIWLQDCDALFYLSSSKGADIELSRAKERGLKIFYNLDEIDNIICI